MPIITFCRTMPVVELLPVLKSRFFTGDFKPILHVRAAVVAKEGLLLDFMKFERDPYTAAKKSGGSITKTDSCVGLALCFSDKDSAPVLVSAINSKAEQSSFCLVENRQEPVHFDDIYIYKGNDEQGWYWGARLFIKLEMLKTVDPNIDFLPGSCVFGNFYAFLLQGSAAHFGAVEPFSNNILSDYNNHAVFSLFEV